MAERTDADWESFIQSKISDLLSASGGSQADAGPLASISSPTDPRFPLAIDHTLLKPDATPAQIDALCHEAIRYGFKVGKKFQVALSDGCSGQLSRPWFISIYNTTILTRLRPIFPSSVMLHQWLIR